MRTPLHRIFASLFLIIILACIRYSSATAQLFDTARVESPPQSVQDTLYVLDSLFIEIDIEAQQLLLHRSGGLIDTFLCSTGDPDLPRGLATRPGIFSIRGKMAKHRSGRFDVMMLYWMPFDGGIGLHALEGNSYYGTLGDAPSSHGCVRLSRETAASLYDYLPVGTRVYVHRGTPARTLILAEGSTADLRIITAADTKLLRRRLDAAKAGRRDDPALREKLALPAGGKGPGKIEVGGGA
jgi:hypothetical protein